MTVKELIEKLKEYEENDEVLCSTYKGDDELILEIGTVEDGIDKVYILLEDLWWMQRCLLIPYKTFRDKIRIVNYYERRGYYIEVWEGYIYCYRGK